MLLHPLWRGCGVTPADALVTQVGVEVLQQTGETVLSQFGAEVLQQHGQTRVTAVAAAALQGRRRTRITQIAAILIWRPTEPEPEPEPGVPCLTAPPVIASHVCAQPDAAPLVCPTTVSAAGLTNDQPTAAPLTCPVTPTAAAWVETNDDPAVQSLGLNESDVQP